MEYMCIWYAGLEIPLVHQPATTGFATGQVKFILLVVNGTTWLFADWTGLVIITPFSNTFNIILVNFFSKCTFLGKKTYTLLVGLCICYSTVNYVLKLWEW